MLNEIDKAIAADLHTLRDTVDHSDSAKVHISDTRIQKVLRLRLIGYTRAYPVWDLQYCYVELDDGSRVHCDLDRDQFSRQYKKELVAICQQYGIYGCGIGLFDAIDTMAG